MFQWGIGENFLMSRSIYMSCSLLWSLDVEPTGRWDIPYILCSNMMYLYSALWHTLEPCASALLIKPCNSANKGNKLAMYKILAFDICQNDKCKRNFKIIPKKKDFLKCRACNFQYENCSCDYDTQQAFLPSWALGKQHSNMQSIERLLRSRVLAYTWTCVCARGKGQVDQNEALTTTISLQAELTRAPGSLQFHQDGWNKITNTNTAFYNLTH
jgi:hypothetical protein